MKANIKFSTLDKIFKFLEKEKREDIPGVVKYLSGELKLEIAEENLSVTKFNNGDPIPEARTPEEWEDYGYERVPAFMRNGNDFHYNHFAVMDKRGICPPGWRIPTEGELNYILIKNLYKDFPRAGFRSLAGSAVESNFIGTYWSSEGARFEAFALLFYRSDIEPLVAGTLRKSGLSVRCIRNKK